VQSYKKVFLLLLIISFAWINEGCHRKVLPTNYPNKPGLFPITIHKKEYRLKRKNSNTNKKLNRVERKRNKKSEKAKRDALKAQERGRERHINQQTPKVQERMKKSLEESENTRRRETFWERLMFWKKSKNKEKKI